MKHKVSDLEDALLDASVAKAEGLQVVSVDDIRGCQLAETPGAAAPATTKRILRAIAIVVVTVILFALLFELVIFGGFS